MIKRSFIKVLVMVLMMGMLSGMASEAKAQTYSKATWLWNPWSLVDQQEEILQFFQARQVNKVYLQIDQDLSPTVYQLFISKASSQGIAVYALDGAPDWAAPKGYLAQDRLFSWLTKYQASSLPIQQFEGVHLDVEPYLYSGWNSKRGAVIKAYQNLYIKAGNQSTQLGIPFEADLPFWFDEIKYNNTFGSGKLSDWVQKHTDGVTIMAYRDTADLIAAFSEHELKTGQSLGKAVTIGVETGHSYEGNNITFHEEGEMYLNQELEKVQGKVSGYKSFSGFAIHHTDSWMRLAP
ncbi:amidase [Jeotgalibacillus sp. R-1-5s-1]|uniref:amidase n=1 Tax=Jeotgalibacillus sp. R-1-5s-1 TaxID=2555897 RepID=UPI001FC80EFF|nr:amidase [Jeotgalibacillus sp. R-1-5s-1]